MKWRRSFPNVQVPSNTVVVLFFKADPLEVVGNYLLRSTLTGAGSLRSRFCAGCSDLDLQDLSLQRTFAVAQPGDGLNVLTFNLNEEARQQFRGANSGADSVFPYITYTTILKPDLTGDGTPSVPGFECFDVKPQAISRNNYYVLVVANLGPDTYTGTVIFKLIGPVKWRRSFPNIQVPGNTGAALFFKAAPLGVVGNYLLRSTLTGAGSLKARFCAGCGRKELF